MKLFESEANNLSYRHILITGGAGFIGSHVADELLRHGHHVRVLDNLTPQVHGGAAPDYLDPDVEWFDGDIRDARAVERALRGIDAVYHFAATVGVGQSMYEIERYTDINCVGTAILLEALARRPVERLVVASSMSIYGEGLYRSADGAVRIVGERSVDQLKRSQWEFADENGAPLVPLPTPETKTPALSSIYALTKYAQERSCLMIGRAYRIPTVALRFFNVYGPRQALSNPYTGVLAIFAARYLNDNPPLVFEDGRQQRDFVSVHDLARACRLCLDASDAPGHAINIGSGKAYSICELAERMACVLGKENVGIEITGKYRMGDIRHCFADTTLARNLIGYEPRVSLEQGMVELADWLADRRPDDHVENARAELSARGLTL